MNLLENKDELKNVINSIKEYVDNKHRTNESLIRRELGSDKAYFLKNAQNELKELNRKNTNNIIEFIDAEREFWQNLKTSVD